MFSKKTYFPKSQNFSLHIRLSLSAKMFVGWMVSNWHEYISLSFRYWFFRLFIAPLLVSGYSEHLIEQFEFSRITIIMSRDSRLSKNLSLKIRHDNLTLFSCTQSFLFFRGHLSVFQQNFGPVFLGHINHGHKYFFVNTYLKLTVWKSEKIW